MNVHNRHLAPLSEAAWSEIEKEASQTLKVLLGGRKLIDFAGPLGWEFSAVNTGRVSEAAPSGTGDVEARTRIVQPLVELRRPFRLSRAEAEAIDRGADDPDLDPLREAARDIAFAEDRAVFNGLESAAIDGICAVAEHDAVAISEDYENYPGTVAQALAALRDAGVGGPYGIALGPRCYTGLNDTRVNGFPVLRHVAALLDGPIVSAPAVDGALVVSLRGGDFSFISGQDFTIGYLEHDATTVHLYIEESFTFRVLGPEAAVPLTYGSARPAAAGGRKRQE